MPFCPKCKYEYREGIRECPDCDLPLVLHLHEDAEEKEPVYGDGNLVTLLSTFDRMEADIIKGVIESAGIPVMIQSSGHSIYDRGRLPQRPYGIVVPGSKCDEAAESLRLAMDDGKGMNWEQWWQDRQS
jgi:hypothetical protein